MQWPDLHAFAAVADGLSFSRAADRLHLTTSAVVRRVQRLERDLSLRLLDRSTVHVALTPAGALLAARLPGLSAHWEQVITDLALPSTASRSLRLGLIELYSTLMAEHITTTMPDIRLDWLTDDGPALLSMLARNDLDMALAARFPDEALSVPAGAHVTTVVHEPIWVRVGLSHRWGTADTLDMADLAAESWVVSPPSQAPHQWETAILGRYPQAHVTAASQIAGRELIDAGRAVAFSSALARWGKTYRIIPLTGLPGSGARHLYLAWNPASVDLQTSTRMLAGIRGFYRIQARRVPAYWDWITRHPQHFPGIV